MELILSTISAGGLVGAANQYACLLIIAISARLKIITLTSQMSFMSSYWFIAIIAVFWLLTMAPAFASILSPGVMNVVNTITNFLSGFLVPFSSAMLSLASIGIFANINPEMNKILETMRFFDIDGKLSSTSYLVAGVGGTSALMLTGMRSLAKPALSASTGSTGTISAPIYAFLENISAIILMFLAYLLGKTNPWLLVELFACVVIVILVAFGFAIYQLLKLKKGIGRLLFLAQVEPKAGLAIATEFFIWGLGWFIWKIWGRGAFMIKAEIIWELIFLFIQPLFISLFAFFPPIMPLIGFISIVFLILVFIGIGLGSAKALMKIVDQKENNHQE
ncbi:MAG: DUF4126 family protein [Anaerolineaceae bacterium]|nr:DUF4126 family protein [Anaerolineaceae bacterium]